MSIVNNEKVDKIIKLIQDNEYELAYLFGKEALDVNPKDSNILEALYSLTARLRTEAIAFSSNKANYSAISSFEKLLPKVNELTGQDMYGRFK